MMPSNKSVLLRCFAATFIPLFFECIVGALPVYRSKNGLPESVLTPNVPTPLKPNAPASHPDFPASHPDHFIEESVYSLNDYKIYQSENKRSQNLRYQKPAGKRFPLDSFMEDDSEIRENSESLLVFPEAIPGIDKKMIALLSSLVSRSQSITESKAKPGKNLDFREKMTDLLTSIVSQEISSTVRQDKLTKLSTVVSLHGLEPDISEKMTKVLDFLVNQQKLDQQVKLQMATLMARILTQDIDEAVTWKMLYILQKIASQEKGTDVKGDLVTILSAIVREENNVELQLETSSVLSTIIHQHETDENRSKMVELLLTIVPSVQKAESRTETDNQDTPEEDLDVVNLLQNVVGEKTPKGDRDSISRMLSVMSASLNEEKGREVIRQLIELVSSLEPSERSMMTVSMERILSEVISAKDSFRTTASEKKGTGELEMVDLLSKLIDEKQAPVVNLDEKVEKDGLLSRVVNEKEISKAYGDLMAELAIIDEEEVQEVDFNLKADMNRVLSNIIDGETEPESDFNLKAKMDHDLSAVDLKNNAPESDLDMIAEMLNTPSNESDREMVEVLSRIFGDEWTRESFPKTTRFIECIISKTISELLQHPQKNPMGHLIKKQLSFHCRQQCFM